jgi:hypothetical protein
MSPVGAYCNTPLREGRSNGVSIYATNKKQGGVTTARQ